MRWRGLALTVSGLLCLAAVLGVYVWPGLNYGVDFAGGTEIQVHFEDAVTTAELRTGLGEMGLESPDVIEVGGADNAFILRLREVSSLPEGIAESVETSLNDALEPSVVAVRVSPGGDKVSIRLDGAADVAAIGEALEAVEGIEIRGTVRPFGNEDDHRYEADLVGISDQVIEQLGERFGAVTPDRVEWVGPRAGEALRWSALRALLYSIALIMVYVAFRFDLRFAPGGIIALIHDALIVVLAWLIMQREFNISTIATLLTIVGYSINDTIVIYDRIRENMARNRDKSLYELINISTTQTLSRTIITSGVTSLSLLAFLVFGTAVIRDISLGILIGMVAGTYSTIYIAAPLTEWMDKRFFEPARAAVHARLKADARRAPRAARR
jgi:preprotein translocase subunit SecF